MIVDLFAGPGGWSEGLRELGLADVGIEIDEMASATRAAAGHETIRADVATYPAERFRGYDGLIMSPPCTDWSQAGRQLGRSGKTGGLVDEVPRWVAAVRPRWVACEQVPPALAVWQDFARLFATWGYSTWAGILEAERYGVPQTRERAILLARRDGPAQPPEPTHQRYEPGVAQGAADECQPSLLGPGRLPWVSMADALGWGYGESPARTVCGARVPRWLYGDADGTHGRVIIETHQLTSATGQLYTRSVDAPSPTLTTNARQWYLRPGGGAGRGAGQRPPMTADRPAPTLCFGNDAASWCWQRPATTVCADPRLGAPGHRDREESVRLTIEEALVLQSFRPDYPVQGGKTKRFEQIGNAVPPLLAAAIIRSLVAL